MDQGGCICSVPRHVVKRGVKLAFAMCLLQCLHCTDEAHIHLKKNRGRPVCSLIAPTWLNLPSA